MNFSYWEQKSWLDNIDFAIIGSGIVGLSCALALRERSPKSRIAVFEKGILPSGASTKNAGFACFGSLSEIVADLETQTEEDVRSLVSERIKGLQKLRDTLGDKQLDYRIHGGFELFLNENQAAFEKCFEKMDSVNALLRPILKADVFSLSKNKFHFKNICPQLFFNPFEGQLDAEKLMHGLIKKCTANDIFIYNAAEISAYSDNLSGAEIEINNEITFSTKKLLIATNGFAKQFLKEDVNPARAQVLITKPIKNLKIKGTFHLEEGYYYFRNVDNRILLGGGRNLDFKTEETIRPGLTVLVQNKLESLLTTTILPNQKFEIDSRWSGTMGVGKTKKPIIKQISENVFCGVRLGGMGVAIGSSVGRQLANLASS